MQKSEHINELAAALSKAQGAMKGALKDAANPFFKSAYSDLASVIDAIRAPFAANGLAFMQFARSDEHGVVVETMLTHASGQWVSESLGVPLVKRDAQSVGSAITYGKRYGIQAMAGVPSEDDDGNAANDRGKASSKAANASESKKGTDTPPEPSDAVVKILESAAKGGMESLQTAWKLLTNPQKKSVQEIMKKLKEDAYQRDKMLDGLGDANEDGGFSGGPEPE